MKKFPKFNLIIYLVDSNAMNFKLQKDYQSPVVASFI